MPEEYHRLMINCQAFQKLCFVVSFDMELSFLEKSAKYLYNQSIENCVFITNPAIKMLVSEGSEISLIFEEEEKLKQSILQNFALVQRNGFYFSLYENSQETLEFISDEEKEAFIKMAGPKDYQVKIAVIGETKVGKSLFINKLRGLAPSDQLKTDSNESNLAINMETINQSS